MTDPYWNFNFRVSFAFPDDRSISAGFWECEGLEMSIEPKTFREGGNNVGPVHLMGKVSYGTLTLKRGLSLDEGLWSWFESMVDERAHGTRAEARIELLDTNRSRTTGEGNLPPALTAFLLTGCLPVRLRTAGFNAKDGSLAVEEMQVAYETFRRDLRRDPPEPQADA